MYLISEIAGLEEEKTQRGISEVQFSQAIVELERKLKIAGSAEFWDPDEMNRGIARVFRLSISAAHGPGLTADTKPLQQLYPRSLQSSTDISPCFHLTGPLSGPTWSPAACLRPHRH